MTKNLKGVGYFLSPLGFIKIEEQNNSIQTLQFVFLEEEVEQETPLIKKAKEQLEEYFNKKRKRFDLPFELKGSSFQQKVYNALTKIPYGATVSYNDVAVMINHPNAYRAVGNANNKNKLFLLVPCHRVTTKSGKLSGREDWTQKQQWLIDFEKEN